MARSLAKVLLVVFGVLFAEVVLQLLAAGIPAVGARLSGLKPRYVFDETLVVRGDANLEDYDIAGFRNASRPERATVVAIGDSQTEGSAVSREKAWPQQLADETGVDVYQLAFGGYGPGQYLALTGEALSLSPKLIVVAVYFGNDIANAYQWTYEERRTPPAPSTDSDKLRAIERTELERGSISDAWDRTRDAKQSRGNSPVRRWLRTNVQERSKLYALYEQISFRFRHGGATLEPDYRADAGEEVSLVADAADPGMLDAFEDGNVSTVFTPAARFATQDLDDPRIAEGLRLTTEVLAQIDESIAGRAKLLVVLIPTKEAVYAEAVFAARGTLPAPLARTIEAEARVHRRIVEFLDSSGIAWVDPADSMSSVVAAGQNAYPSDWEGHPNANGNRAIARSVARAPAFRALADTAASTR